MSLMVAPCPSCGLHHAGQTLCPVGLVLDDRNSAILPPGEMIASRYRILTLLHRGPMSTVYRVQDRTRAGEAVVLKELTLANLSPSERAEALSWFLREAHLLSTLRHQALPVLHASFSDGDRSYLVMEEVPGISLEAQLRRGPLPEDLVLQWGVELCDVLQFLHSQPDPIVYRDLKPANVLERGDTGRLVLVDFGVARRATPGVSATAVGTPGYAAPEQYQGLADARSDIYALGATLHRLLTGYEAEHQPPFRQPPVQVLRPDISPAAAAVVSRALSLSPEARYYNAAQMRDALRAAIKMQPTRVHRLTAPFYYWSSLLPLVTVPLTYVSFLTLQAPLGYPSWSWQVFLLCAYLPALLYLLPLCDLYNRARHMPGPATTQAVHRARNLLVIRLGMTAVFWATLVLCLSLQALDFSLPLLLLGAIVVCWMIGIWRASSSVARPSVQRLPRLTP